MIALGLDPGTLNLGWGVVSRAGNKLTHVDHGVIKLDGKLPLAERLRLIDQQLSIIVTRYRPDVGSVESLFFHRDAQAAAKLGHARGVVLLALARAGVQVAEYAPAQVKRTIAGKGDAEKRQVALMVRAVLSLAEVPAADAADALALALTHLRFGPMLQTMAARAPARPRRRARRPVLPGRD